MKKSKYKYMHTMEGLPSTYDGNQIVYCTRSYPAKLVSTLEEIRRQRRKSAAWRRNKGLDEDICAFGYVRVVV